MPTIQPELLDRFTALLRREEGQTMAEYGVILALIAVVVAATLVTLEGNISGALAAVGGRL